MMDSKRKKDSSRTNKYNNGRPRVTQNRDRQTKEIKPPISNTTFSKELKKTIIDVFCDYKQTKEHNVTKDEVKELFNFKPSSHFNSYLNCCICYENTLLCAIGRCDHMTCLLCSLKLTHFYKNEENKGIYECPYCKQQNDYIYFCVNPFYIHLLVNKKFYSSKDNPVMTKEELKEFIQILTKSEEHKDTKSKEIMASATINIMQLYEIFLKNTSKVVNKFTINGLLKSVSNLNISGEKTGFPNFQEKNNDQMSFSEDCLIVDSSNLIFESAGIYYVYKLITAPLCWMPECKATWYNGTITKENVRESMKKMSKFKFTSYKFLNRHIKATHSLVFCDICLNYFSNRKFLCELVLYPVQRIGEHVINGDVNSYPPISAHVFCAACKTYHWDMTAFKKHAKDEHFICEVCDSYEDTHNVFSDYTTLFNHFKTYHYPCEEEECMFIVFADDIQLQLHYLYKHPGVERSKSNRKPLQINTKVNREPKSTTSSSLYSNYDDQSYETFWDGSINIVSTEKNQPLGEETKKDEEDEQKIEDTPLAPLFVPLEDTSVSPEKDKAKLQTFLDGLKGNKDLPVGSDYINNFDATRSSHVFKDLDCMMQYLKTQQIKLFEVTKHLPKAAAKLYVYLVTCFKNRYDQTVKDVTTTSSDPNFIFNLVKSYLMKLLFLFYSLQINKPREDPKKISFKMEVEKMREHNPEIRLSPNTTLFLISILNLAAISNLLIVKASMNSLITDMKGMYRDVQEHLSLSEAFNLPSQRNSQIPSSALNPNANIDEYIHKKPRNQNIVKIPRKPYIVSLKGKKYLKNKEPPRPEPPGLETTKTSIEEPPSVEEDHPTPININDGLICLEPNEVDTETLFFNHVANSNFYGLMYDMIGSMLVSNMKRFKAKTFEYSLRETTKLKILNIALSQKRSFTNLCEFVSMKKLESLQSLEPEFHRLAKESKNSDLTEVAKVWSRKCTNILRNTQVEHLEIIHFYLKGNSDTSMPLFNDNEFPSLSNSGNFTEEVISRNYASAVGQKPKPKFLNDHEFPSLDQTFKIRKNKKL